ncbi:DUF3071 domain-containing protein [Nocardioides sp. TRM66260-LWL]|nr:DUF3071 domain-containing protein [Nocardioides sp. TRM66260-LWL]
MSADRRRLLLVDPAGNEFTLDVDHRLRAALRGETSRLGQLEIPMDSVLRPRDIQARIRAGETPEAVAEAAQTSLERILPFAGPVLAERQHVAERAQRSSLRRRGADAGGGARILGDAVAAHLRGQDVDPESVVWDAWRREDGRWTLTAEFATIKRTGTARFTYDMPGSFVLLEDDDARWLVGEVLEQAPAPRDDLEDVRRRRLAGRDEPGASVADQPLLGDDALGLVQEAESHPVEAFLETEAPDPAREPDVVADERRRAGEAAEAGAAEVAPPEAQDDTETLPATADQPPTAPRRPAKGRRGRASVPSWDEIMFGGGKQE